MLNKSLNIKLQGFVRGAGGFFFSKVLLPATLIVLAVSAWFFIDWLYKTENFPIKKVELVNKLENQESAELQTIASRAINGGFFSLDVDKFRAELLAKLPWVEAVTVRKIWPNRLLVAITEHKPVVRWTSSTQDETRQFRLLSDKGIIFQPELTSFQLKKFNKTALFFGPEMSEKKVFKTCVQLNENLKKLNDASGSYSSTIKQCGMNERRSWLLTLDSGVIIKLGKENIIQSLNQFITVFSTQLKQYYEQLETVDLRFSNGFSVNWKEQPDDISGHDSVLK